ncbi:MAG: N-acyl homoserine lactonase family protein [Alphaproteobacteria bacterium]
MSARNKVFAIRYASRKAERSSCFLGGPADDAPVQMDYFVWAIIGEARAFVVDTGFCAPSGAKRGRVADRDPVHAIERVGLQADIVTDVIQTHLHYDHAGGLSAFPAARFHMHARELEFAAGPLMRFDHLAQHYERAHVDTAMSLTRAGRVAIMEEPVRTLAPGVELHHVGGHSDGLTCVRVMTKAGWLLLASDICHFRENLTDRRPFPVAANVVDMLRAYETAEALADGADLIIPGHDPDVMERFPAAGPQDAGIVARLDGGPKETPLSNF